MTDLSKNTNPYYPSYTIKKHLQLGLNNINLYPPINNTDLEIKISKYFKMNEDNTYIAKGTLEAFDTLLKQLKIKKIGFLTPTFWGMQVLAEKNGCKLVKECIDGDNYDKKQIDALAKKVDMLYLCNPNNPTLAYINRYELEHIVSNNPKCHFVIDETLLSFSPSYNTNTLYKLVKKYSNLSVFISFSKIFSLGGLRVAIMFSNNILLEKIKEQRLMFSSNIITNYIIDDLGREYFRINRNLFKKNFSEFLSILNMKYVDRYIDKNVSFIIVKFKPQICTSKLIKYLKNNDYIVADISAMYMELEKNWIRISVGKNSELKKLAKLINSYLEKKYD